MEKVALIHSQAENYLSNVEGYGRERKETNYLHSNRGMRLPKSARQ